ncbi:MAG TPA: nitrite/sulfite reductase [Candidatus Binataceae bacterium]|nr:nitrite/sulfite reductase [Candidatus Binataceae bacterium]
MPKREPPSLELVLKRNSVERIKREMSPVALLDQWQERLVAPVYEHIPEEDIVRLRWFGLYHDSPKVGLFMMRVKIPSGILSPAGLRVIGEVSEQWGRNHGELTTRQNIQLHYLTLEKFPVIFERLDRVGLTTRHACGDVARNVTGCPVAGIDRDEFFDVTKLVAETAKFYTFNPDYEDLPRKHKITIAACKHQCNAPEINDIAMVGMVHPDGRRGFAIQVGGGQSSTPRLARHLGVFVMPEQALAVMRAITDVWKNTTEYRLSRVRARLKFMLDDYGPDGFRQLVETRLGRELERLADPPPPEPESDHMGIHPQREPGRVYVGFPVYLGLMSGTQMKQIAALAEEIGGDIRLTRRQNFILTGIPEARIDEITTRVAEIGFPLDVNQLYASSIGCIGDPNCNFAVTPTKSKLATIIQRLVTDFGDTAGPLKVNLDGCPHACGQHWTGDIGLQGTTGRGPSGEPLMAYDIILRGGLGRDAAIGKPLLRRVPADYVEDYVSRLVASYIERRQPDETFTQYCKRTPDAALIAIAHGSDNVMESASEPAADEA